MKCALCPKIIVKTSNRQLYCEDCRKNVNKKSLQEYYKKTYIKKGYNQSGEFNNNWKGGIGTYRKHLREKCEKCGSHETLLVHHKDEDRYNNNPENLQTLCKRCHQIEHECQKNLPRKEKLAELKRKQSASAKRDSKGRFSR